jgi:ankyrin repeat protein
MEIALRNDDVGDMAKYINKDNVENYVRSDEWNYIHEAAYQNKPMILQYLLDLGGDPLVKSSSGMSPHYIISGSLHNPVKCFLILVKYISDIDEQYGAYNMLTRAINTDNRSITKLLIDRGASISNVSVVTIPDWVTEFVNQRDAHHRVALIFIGIHKFKRITNPNGRDSIRLIAKQIWSMRPH